MFGNDWDDVLREEVEKPYFNDLRYTLAREYKLHKVYPPKEDLFSALKLTPFHLTKAVILGQDPYHGEGQAHGLSFSVRPGVRTPPSLLNIYKELRDDIGTPIPNQGYLVPWAEQGVLLLNNVLTVREGQPQSHQGIGWERFTDAVIEAINEREQPAVFILWGAMLRKSKLREYQQAFGAEIRSSESIGGSQRFFWQQTFSRTNAFLQEHGMEPIRWEIHSR